MTKPLANRLKSMGQGFRYVIGDSAGSCACSPSDPGKHPHGNARGMRQVENRARLESLAA